VAESAGSPDATGQPDPSGPFEEIAATLADDALLDRAVAAGRRRGTENPWRRLELRYVDLKGGRHLQVTRLDATQAFTENHALDAVPAVVAALVAEPWANWHVWTPTGTLQLRVTKKGRPLLHRERIEPADLDPDATGRAGDPTGEPGGDDGGRPVREHDRAKSRLLAEDDPVLVALGISDAAGRVKPSRQAKYRQVEEFLRRLDAAIGDAFDAGALPRPTDEAPLTVVDLGCGNAYLTFAAHRYLAAVRGLPVRLVGVDVKEQSLRHNSGLAHELGVDTEVTFVQGSIGAVALPSTVGPVGVVLALHACDTATDDALAQALAWQAPLVLAAPCCHHDVAAQLRSSVRGGSVPATYAPLVRDGILRERFADTLTDAVRAAELRQHGYRVDVVEFVESRHTPRNTMIQAVRTGAPVDPAAVAELRRLREDWGLTPRLSELLA
jgi:SAM-dependent methyltransferase